MVRDSVPRVTPRRCRQPSLPGSDYFLSLQTFADAPGLDHASVAAVLLAEAKAMGSDGTWNLRSVIVLPVRMHLMMTLGNRLTLGRCIQRLKAKSAPVLWSRGLDWEGGFFVRQLRAGTVRAQVLRYLRQEPARQGLVNTPDIWPWYYSSDADRVWLKRRGASAQTEPKWLLARRY